MLRFVLCKLAGILLALSVAGVSVRADQVSPTVFATAWGETLEQDGSGFYNEIAADVLRQTPKAEHYQIMPYRRAKVSFFADATSCLYPSSLSALVKGADINDAENYIESDGLFTARTHLFVRAGETPPKSLADLSGKTIAYPNGSVVRNIIEGHGARLISVNNEQDKAEMLLSGRVDMISGMIPDTAIVFSNIEGEMPVYDPSLALYEVPVTFVCHKTAENEEFVTSLNEALRVLSQDAKYLARMAAASLAQDELARASGDKLKTTIKMLNDLAPSAGGGKPSTKHPSGRRIPMRSNR